MIYLVERESTLIDPGSGYTTPSAMPKGSLDLQLSPTAYLVDGEDARDVFLRAGQGISLDVQVRLATAEDLPEETAFHPTTDEMVAFCQAARRRRGNSEKQPLATDRTSALSALDAMCGC